MQLTYGYIKDMFVRYSRHSERKVHAHMLRHSYATEMLRRGAKERHIQLLLGHEYITTTQHYLSVVNSDLARCHNEHF